MIYAYYFYAIYTTTDVENCEILKIITKTIAIFSKMSYNNNMKIGQVWLNVSKFGFFLYFSYMKVKGYYAFRMKIYYW